VSEPSESKINSVFALKKTTAPTDSHILTYYSTNAALPSLTLEIGRDPVLSRRYGRSCNPMEIAPYKLSTPHRFSPRKIIGATTPHNLPDS
jgi:hypothetical protein